MIYWDNYIVKAEKGGPRKLYKMTCIECSRDRGYQRKHRYASGLCKRCISIFTHKNKIVSAETKKKMSDNNWIKKSGRHPMFGKFHTEETKRKISEATCKQNKNRKTKHEYVGINGCMFMKSSWEVKYAEWLDLTKQSWNYEPMFKLSNGKTYLSDFKLSNGDIIEIKGYFRSDAKLKWDMFCMEYPLVKKNLLRKEDLKKLGIL